MPPPPPPKLSRTPRLGVVFQFTPLPAPAGVSRAWQVHDVERNRGFRVSIPEREASAAPKGAKAIGRPWTEAELEAGVLVALERALETPPEKKPGEVYDLTVTADDLHRAAARA